MSRDLPPLNALRAFEAAARRASFKAAAAELLVTPTAVSHQIRQLEAWLGARLFDRGPRAVALTPEGRGLYEAASAAFAEIGRATARLRAPPALTLSSSAAFLGHWLVPRLAELRRLLPEVEVRLHASDALVAVGPGGVDVAVRYGRGPYEGLDATPLVTDSFAPVCSPQLGIRAPSDLRRATLIHVEGRVRPRPAPTWSRWCEGAGVTGVDTAAGARLPDSMLAAQAAIAGQGVVLASPVLVDRALAAGLLARPFAYALPGDTYHFVCAPERAARPEIVALRAWLGRAMACGAAPARARARSRRA